MLTVMLGAAELPSGVPSNDGHFIGTGMSWSDPILHLVLVNYRMIGGYDMDTAPTNLPGVSLAVVVKQNPQQPTLRKSELQYLIEKMTWIHGVPNK